MTVKAGLCTSPRGLSQAMQQQYTHLSIFSPACSSNKEFLCFGQASASLRVCNTTLSCHPKKGQCVLHQPLAAWRDTVTSQSNYVSKDYVSRDWNQPWSIHSIQPWIQTEADTGLRAIFTAPGCTEQCLRDAAPHSLSSLAMHRIWHK